MSDTVPEPVCETPLQPNITNTEHTQSLTQRVLNQWTALNRMQQLVEQIKLIQLGQYHEFLDFKKIVKVLTARLPTTSSFQSNPITWRIT